MSSRFMAVIFSIILSVAFGFILLFEARLWLRDVAISNVLGQVGSFTLTVSVTLAGIGTLMWYVGANIVNGYDVGMIEAGDHARLFQIRFGLLRF